MSSLSKTQQQEIADWFDLPITQNFYVMIEEALERCHEDKRFAYNPEKPDATQERLAWLHGAEWAFHQLMDMKEDRSFGNE